MGACSTRGIYGLFDNADVLPNAVSIEKAISLSNNAATTAARYHFLQNGGRQLSDDYEIDGRVLGQGLCGDVVLVRGKTDGRHYALKRIGKDQVALSKLSQLTAEVEIYLSLDHPNIARLHNVYETASDISLLTECCEGGELYFRLQKRGVYEDSDAAESARQMLRAIGYLHAHHVVHRDVKLENFLYETEEPQGGKSQLKLIDFGFAKNWDPCAHAPMMASCGSIAYVSPDVLRARGYDNKCDLWSLGVIVWMLLCGYPPFHGNEKSMIAKIKAGALDWSHRSRWKHVQTDAVDFVKSLLVVNPALRLDAQEALQHPWLVRTASGTPAVLGRDALRSMQRYAKAPKVRRAALQLLAQELAPEETWELREAFLSIDRSNQGTICFRDLKDAIRAGAKSRSPQKRRTFGGIPTPLTIADGNPEPVPELPLSPTKRPPSPTTPGGALRRANSGVLDDLLRLLNANGDEQIYYSDFLAATMGAQMQEREGALRAAFNRFDADLSGTISVDDLRSVIGDSFEGVDVEELMLQANPRGCNEISFEDFMQIFEECGSPTKSPSKSARQRPKLTNSPPKRISFFPQEVNTCEI